MRLLVAIASIFVALALGLWRWTPEAPADGPPDTFSAFRARRVQEAIAKDGPRPTGSPNAAAARDFLLEKLKIDGYEAHVEHEFACARRGSCAFVDDIVGRRGPAGRPAILLAAHYDSVPAAPGASDDGMGVAAVSEAARALATGDPGRPVMVLFTDAEESGLLGADAFAKRHRGDVFVSINCDARGTTGPSMMFETSGGSDWLVARFAEGSPRPITSSLFREVYRRMPNDTDFTILKGLAPGINIANVSGVTRYHTVHDSLAQADPRTLQHHGDQILGVARAFGHSEPTPGDAVWFDVLGAFVVRWPEPWSTPLAIVTVVLVFGQLVRKRAFGIGLFAGLASMAGAALATFGVGQLLALTGCFPVGWIAHPLPAAIALISSALLAGLGASFVFRDRPADARWAGTWMAWAAIGVAVSRVAPGASYLFVVPSLVAGFAAFASSTAAAIVPAFVAALLWMPLAPSVYDAAGFFAPAAVGLPMAVLVPTLAPLVHEARRRWFLVPATSAAVAALVATLVPPFSTSSPQRVNVIVSQEGSRAEIGISAAWGATPWGAPPREMVALLTHSRHAQIVPWGSGVIVGDLASSPLPPPTATVTGTRTEHGRRVVQATLQSARHATTLVIEAPPDVRVRAHGIPVVRRSSFLTIRGVPPEGVDVELDAPGDAIPIVLRDVTSGLPDAAAAIVNARPATAAPSQRGDLTVSVVHTTL